MYIYNFDQFILESTSNYELPFIMSDPLIKTIGKTNHPIGWNLIAFGKNEFLNKITLLDTEFDDDFVTFSQSNQIYNNIYKNSIFGNNYIRRHFMSTAPVNYELWKKGRSKIKIGRLIKQLFPDKYTNTEIETFVNKFKVANTRIPSKFEIWRKVSKAYKTYKYSDDYGEENPLYQSCMNDADYLNIYDDNKDVVNVIVMLEGTSIIGRALLWTLSNGEKFMDRVYYINDKDYYKFIEYAKENNFIYKSKNKSSSHIKYIIPKKDAPEWIRFEIKLKYSISNYNELPYMDTLIYGYDKILTNESPKKTPYYKLTDTDGDYTYYG